VDLVVGVTANNPPVLAAIGNKTVAEQTQLAFTATATDDNPGLTFSLANPVTGTFPAGAQITAAGAFTWTPTEAQGPGTYRVRVIVTDAGLLTDEEEIQIVVTEVNLPPVLSTIGGKTVDEETQLTFTATATDPDIPANSLTFTLLAGTDPVPAGAAIDPNTGAFMWTPTEAQGPGTFEFKVRVTDNGVDPANLYDEEQITVTVNEVNRPPVLDLIAAQTTDEGVALSFTATASDPDIPANTLSFSIQTGGNIDLGSAAINSLTGVFTWTPADDNPTGTAFDQYTVKVIVTDNGVNPQNLSDDQDVMITVDNVAPVIASPLGLPITPVAVNTPVNLTGSFTDQGKQDTHTASIDWDDGFGADAGAVSESMGSGSVSRSHTYTAPGIYTVTLTVTDDDTGNDTERFEYVVVYDPSAGFVTGGGWINSPLGAYVADQSLSGKATFGFVSKYLKGANTPTGNTEFQFHAGGMNFSSTSYEWLVVQGTNRATYKGSGTINGSGDYGFLLAAYDGGTTGDRFRIKIWVKSTKAVVYDNEMGTSDDATPTTTISNGSIVIHVPKK
jgi:PKD repeat protein